MKKTLFYVIFCLLLISMAGCNVSVNKSLYVANGEKSPGQNTVNGNIDIGKSCEITGKCRTVNGHIDVGESSQVRTLETVNGSIALAARVTVEGDLKAVNGAVTCQGGTTVEGRIAVVNGMISLQGAAIDEGITDHNGDIILSGKSTVRGDIVIKKSHNHPRRTKPIVITISENSVVMGDIISYEHNTPVVVRLLSGGRVNGRIENAEVVRSEPSSPSTPEKQIQKPY